MSLDEHLIECVLEILGDERVSKQLYKTINKDPFPQRKISIRSDKSPIIAAKERQTELQKKIKNLEEENTALYSKNEELSKFCSEKNDKLIQKSKDIQDCQNRIDDLSQKLCEQDEKLDLLSKEKSNLMREKEQYYKSFCLVEKPLDVYNVYKSLPEELRKRNLNFISENSLFAFVSTGVMYLERLWEFIKEELLEDRMEYTDKLKVVFDFLFEMKNDIEKMYIRNECKIGDAYNCDKHIMRQGGQNLGVVSEILFLGFSDNNGKLIKKTIVKVNKN